MRTFMMVAAAATLIATSASAQMATTTTTTKMAGKPAVTTMHKGPMPKSARSEISLTCSSQADTKGLHGKDREKFRRACMKGK
jgi:phosphate-selective porin